MVVINPEDDAPEFAYRWELEDLEEKVDSLAYQIEDLRETQENSFRQLLLLIGSLIQQRSPESILDLLRGQDPRLDTPIQTDV